MYYSKRYHVSCAGTGQAGTTLCTTLLFVYLVMSCMSQEHGRNKELEAQVSRFEELYESYRPASDCLAGSKGMFYAVLQVVLFMPPVFHVLSHGHIYTVLLKMLFYIDRFTKSILHIQVFPKQ